MSNLRAGLIGLGMMGRHHARVLASMDGVELAAVADPEGDRFGAVGDAPVFSSVDTVIEQGIDYCVVAVPTRYHLEVVLRLAEAGVHALVEKPLAHDTEAARRLVETFETNGLIGGVGHIERYNAALQQARARIEAGDLGEIHQVATRRQGPFPGRIADVGVVKDLGTHDFDLTAWVTQQNYESVSAQTAYKSGREHEDLVTVVGRLSGGTVATHQVNWLSPFKERTTVITGERGALIADTLTADLTYYENGEVATTWDSISRFRGVSEGNVTRFAFAKPEPLRVEHEAFRDRVLGRPSSIVTFRQGAQTLAVAEACIESAISEETVSVPLISGD